MRTAAVLAIALSIGLVLTAACSSSGSKKSAATSTPAASAQTTPQPLPTVSGTPTVTASGLKIIDITVGTGGEAIATSTVTANYTGWLEDGTMFDTSVGGAPVTFSLAQVIKGWQEGVPGMKVGGKRRLIIPPELGYGAAGRGTIPPNATLIFDIELTAVQ